MDQKKNEQPVTISNREWRLVALSANANLKGSASADNSTAVFNSGHSMKIWSIQVKNATPERSELVNTLEKTNMKIQSTERSEQVNTNEKTKIYEQPVTISNGE